MKMNWMIIVTAILLGNGALMGNTAIREMPVLPTPQDWSWQEGNFQLAAALTIQTDSAFCETAFHLQQLLGDFAGLNLTIARQADDDLGQPGIHLVNVDNPIVRVWLTDHQLSFTAEMANEGYILWIDSLRLLLIAKTDAGCFYGVQSIHFLLREQAPVKELPAVVIRDWPSLQLRGITDDISRGQVSSLANFKTIIRFLAEYKMNVYMPYLEDLFQFKSYPTIGKDRGALTAEECLELQDYAEKLHVQIIPIFQTLGHYENLLMQSEFRHLAEYPGAAALNSNSEDTYQFLEIVLAEIVPVFRSVYFHIGADESWDVGRWATRQLTARYGVASIHAQHYRRVFDILKKYQKRIMIYGDIILENPQILNEIPNDIIIFDWQYGLQPYYESTEFFKKTGQPFIVSPAIHNWNLAFPNLTNALANIYQFTKDGSTNGALGAITSNWGDFGSANFRELNYYPYAFAAECAWNIHDVDIPRFEQNFFIAFFGSNDPAIANVFHLLTQMSQQVDLPHFFSQPFYPIGDNVQELIRHGNELPVYSRQVSATIERLRSEIRYNSAQLDYLQFCSDLFAYSGRLSQLQVNLFQTNKYQIEPEVRKTLAPRYQEELRQLAAEVKRLKETYRQLWLSTNRPENLERIITLFERLELSFLIKADEIAAGNFTLNGQLPAPFISHPRGIDKDKPAEVGKIYLRKTFHLEQTPANAGLQLIADSHARVWVNGKEIGEVLGRRTLSALVESQRVQWWNVAAYLKKGENLVAVEVQNYIPNGIAAANLWLDLQFKDRSKITITTDAYWKVSDQSEQDWQLSSFNDDDWLPAVPVENNWHICRPYFEYSLPSRIEFYR